jgi:hypothetical protein
VVQIGLKKGKGEEKNKGTTQHGAIVVVVVVIVVLIVNDRPESKVCKAPCCLHQ